MMALIGCGKMDPYDLKFENGKFVPTDDAWAEIVEEQEKIATEIRTKYSQPGLVPGGEGVVIGNATKYINNRCGFNSSKFKYENRLYYYSNKGHFSALNDVIDCLYYDAVPIIRVQDTTVLGYYDKSFQHYIVVESVDLQAESMNIIDPHYDNKYYGLHTISFEEFYKIADNTIGMWLSVYTDKGKQPGI